VRFHLYKIFTIDPAQSIMTARGWGRTGKGEKLLNGVTYSSEVMGIFWNDSEVVV
jgi:hypothetical protein